MEKIVLIDGHSILNRAFFGVPDLTNSEGTHVNAIYGFLNMMFMIIEEEQPDYITVAFDVHAPTFRHELFAEYKGTRSPMAPELREQVPLIQEVLKSMGIQVCTLPGFEADDVLGTIAKLCQSQGIEVKLVSGDRDLLQISDEHIQIRIPKTKAGKTTIENYYPEDVITEYGVDPITFIDLKAFMGDTSDNVKGVTGVGPKSATKLLLEYGNMDGVYAHIDEFKPSALKENLIRDKEQAYLARTLVTIKTDAPISFELEQARIGNFFNEESYVYFKKLEFKNYLNKFEVDAQVSTLDIEALFKTIDDLAEADAYFNELKRSIVSSECTDIALYIPTDDSLKEAQLDIVTLCANNNEVVSIVREGFITEDYLKKAIYDIASYETVNFVLYGAKNQYQFFDIYKIEDRCFDTIIASYLLNPLRSDYDYEYIASLYNGEMIPGRDTLLDKKLTYSELLTFNREQLIKYSSYVVYTIHKAKPKLLNALIEEGMLELFRNIEMPLSVVLSSMERVGIRIRPETLSDYSADLGNKLEILTKKIYEEAGEEFNILSPKQLGVILFEKMNLPGGKKTKTGYSTSADVLEKMKDVPLVADILEYRAISKLKSTYADGLVPYIDENNRIHSTFHQTITATGRISSADPNLQNIPTRTELGKGIRKAFIPSDGCILADADYSQIELRILAHIAGDESLIQSYKEGSDIHRITASKVFGVPFEEVTDLQRRNAKAVNFGIVYGISSYGLSEDLKISKKEAAGYIEQYFETFPGIKSYLDSCVEEAKEKGFVTTMYGRKRPIPELSSSNFMQRQFGERVAMNSPIQGTAADIMKIAMINVYRRLKEEGLKSRLVLQVHDELIIDTIIEEKDIVCSILESEMENAAKLKVRLVADLHTGIDWLEAK